jgi:exonuclease III
LTKSRLEEFRVLLNQLNPELVFLSETHWSPLFNVKFKFYHVLKRDRLLHRGGGVALLIKKSIQFSVKPPINLNATEAIGATIFTNSGEVDCFSVYSPKGDCSPEDIHFFLSTTHPFILAGDLNAHHHLWESSPTENVAGKSIGNALIESPDTSLITPMDLGTRINPSSGKLSTIDLIITSPVLALNSTIVLGPHCGSDHLPVITTLNANPIHLASRPPTWIFDKTRWPQWNPCAKSPKEPRRPWWNDDCQKAVASAKKAEKNGV